MSPSHSTNPNPATNVRRGGGFTLIELVVTMGILTGFLVMLTQLVGSGMTLFTSGEITQSLADRTNLARRVITRELSALRGDAAGRDRSVAEDRLLVQELPIGLPARPELRATRVQVLRAAVHLSAEREEQLVESMLVANLAQNEPDLNPVELQARLAELRARQPLRGIGNLLLLPWRQEGKDDALLELRAGWFLPGQRVQSARDEYVDPFEVMVPGGPDLPALVVHAHTTPILEDLLHVEFRFWSQTTTSWRQTSGGPLSIWDSTRGGWLVDAAFGGTFGFDRGPQSLREPTDDIHPHAILVRCVVAQPAEYAPEGLLDAPIAADEERLELVDGSQFPGSETGGWIKVDGEWMRYDRLSGNVLHGLSRGQRNTKAIEHGAGVRVHVGRDIEFVVPVAHAKDDWNG